MPNFSVGGEGAIAALQDAAGAGAELLDTHYDAAHARCVLTLAADPQSLADSLLAAARVAIETLDLRHHHGEHPRIGVLDVCPVVYPTRDGRPVAVDAARGLAGAIAELGVPVFLYGDLASSVERRERHYFRRGGPAELERRMRMGLLAPDLGPAELHPTAGASLVTARPPIAAFNLELAPGADLDTARRIAAGLRESGGGPPGVRAIAIDLGRGRVQVSTNVHDPVSVSLGRVVSEVARLAAESGARVECAELIGLIPRAALRDYPEEVPIRGFDARRSVIEERIARSA